MGMYDTLNGEQVKCFPWFSFYVSAMDTKGVVTSHGGDLKYYGNGSEIPYRSLAYKLRQKLQLFLILHQSLALMKSENGLHM